MIKLLNQKNLNCFELIVLVVAATAVIDQI